MTFASLGSLPWSDVWPAIELSLRISLVATVVTAVIGIPLAFLMTRRRFFGRGLIEGLILMPLVLPPTVVGYLIIMALGARGWFSQWLGGYSIVFRFEGAVLAAAAVALPMLYLPAKAAFVSIEREVEEVARILGARWWRIFWRISLPLARRGVASGLVLAFARALGEFGATVMVYGWQPGNVTLPISIYADYEQGELRHATLAVVALSVISLVMVMICNSTSTARPG
jgi:molybdate transport system permease protein